MFGDSEDKGVNVVDLSTSYGLARPIDVDTKYDPRVLEGD